MEHSNQILAREEKATTSVTFILHPPHTPTPHPQHTPLVYRPVAFKIKYVLASVSHSQSVCLPFVLRYLCALVRTSKFIYQPLSVYLPACPFIGLSGLILLIILKP